MQKRLLKGGSLVVVELVDGVARLKDDAPQESAKLSGPKIMAADITADLEAAMEQFAIIADELRK